jgi:hypothetical protein
MIVSLEDQLEWFPLDADLEPSDQESDVDHNFYDDNSDADSEPLSDDEVLVSTAQANPDEVSRSLIIDMAEAPEANDDFGASLEAQLEEASPDEVCYTCLDCWVQLESKVFFFLVSSGGSHIIDSCAPAQNRC